jgi:predicted phosphodiesterase
MCAGILFYGDPHGEFRPLFRAVELYHPAAVVLLGDTDLEKPLRQQLAPILNAGIPVRWIHGNHDVDREDWHDRLFEDDPKGSIHAHWASLDRMIVAGLGGIFKAKIWYPKDGLEAPVYSTRRDLLRSFARNDRFRGGLPLHQRATILPEDFIALNRIKADILVTHEAPSSHRHGFGAIDDLAHAMKVKLVVHGHHHKSYDLKTRDGIWVRGLDKAEPWLVTRDVLE